MGSGSKNTKQTEKNLYVLLTKTLNNKTKTNNNDYKQKQNNTKKCINM